MAKSKAIGEVSLKVTSVTVSPGPGGSTVHAINFEGTGSRAGVGSATIVATAAFVGGKSGTYSFCGAGFFDNGDVNHVNATGTYESTGKHHWRTVAAFQFPDGVSVISEGELDLADRSWKATTFENK